MISLFERFKETMITNEELCNRVIDHVLKDKTPAEIKGEFSNYLVVIHDQIYEEFLHEQDQSGQRVIDEEISRHGTVNFTELDKFILSLSQSRKSRAGRAFELIIENLLTRLGYPFSTQVIVEGAKPDYVLPSEDYFAAQPLDSILLTAKRTLRERWRQVVTEANKGYGYFLATIDEKISRNQIDQASKHKIFIVVPRSIRESVDHYKDSYSVITFEDFFRNYLDPAMARWGMSVQEPEASKPESEQKSLF